MASTFGKRLEKIEAMLASKISQPLAFIWVEPGQSKQEAVIARGYDPSQIDRMMFCRWLDPELGEAPPEFSWDQVNVPGPPKDETEAPVLSRSNDAGQTVRGEDPRPEAGASPAAREPDFEAESRYREAVEQLERDRINEKLFEASKRFAKSIV